MSASCSIAPDSRRSDRMGRWSFRNSGARLSWLRAITGTSSSLAMPLRERDISEISCWRDSALEVPPMSCK